MRGSVAVSDMAGEGARNGSSSMKSGTASTRLAVRAASTRERSTRVAQRTIEDQQHGGGRSPDIALTERNRPVVAAARPEHPEMPLLVGRVQQEVQRHLEHVRDLD